MKIGRYIVGLLSGLTFGVLFAPKKGKNLRKEVFGKGSKSGQEGLAVLVDAFKEAGMEVISEVKKISDNEQVSAAISTSKDKMREYLSQLEETGYDVAARAQEKIEELTEMAEDTASDFKKRAVQKEKAAVKTVKKAAKKVRKTAKKAEKTVKKAVSSKPAKKAPAKKKTTTKKPAAKKTTPRKKATTKKK
jgi:gas vesicle protein